MASISSQTNPRGKWMAGEEQLGPGDHGGRLVLGTSKRFNFKPNNLIYSSL